MDRKNQKVKTADHEKPGFSHINENGAVMVDVGEKAVTRREACARGSILVGKAVMEALLAKNVRKGDVLTVAQIAGIMGAKKTPELIPLCHVLPLSSVSVLFEIDADAARITAVCTASCEGKTGVEMEALTGVSAALLTIYDMCKAIDHSMMIEKIYLISKSGGKSGTYLAESPKIAFE